MGPNNAQDINKEIKIRLSIKSLSITCGIIWGVLILISGIGNLIFPPYGAAFLNVIDSLYPGYHFNEKPGFGSVIIGTLYGVLDGAVGGAIFAWVYNCLARHRRQDS